MKFTNSEEKSKVSALLNGWLRSAHLTNLKSLCDSRGMKYKEWWRKININDIDLDDVNHIIHLLDESVNLIRDEHGNFEIR